MLMLFDLSYCVCFGVILGVYHILSCVNLYTFVCVCGLYFRAFVSQWALHVSKIFKFLFYDAKIEAATVKRFQTKRRKKKVVNLRVRVGYYLGRLLLTPIVNYNLMRLVAKTFQVALLVWEIPILAYIILLCIQEQSKFNALFTCTCVSPASL